MDNLRRFLVVFSAMLVIAAAVCGIKLVRSYNSSNKDLVEELEVSAPTYDPSGQVVADNFRNNILVIVADENRSESQLMFVLNVDSATNSLNFLLLPSELKFNIASGRTVGSFGSMYYSFSAGNAANCASTVASFFDIDVNYYLRLSTEEAAKLIGSFSSADIAGSSGVLFDIPVDVFYRDYDNGVIIDYKKGQYYLNGEDAVKFLSFYRTEDNNYSKDMLYYYDGTDSKRLFVVQKFIEAFISQKFLQPTTDFYIRSFQELMQPFVDNGESNLNEAVLKRIGNVLGETSAQRIGYFIPLGDLTYNERLYLSYNNFIRNMQLDENISPSTASDVLGSRFKTVF
ncbi:MAG: LCP family protein [Clostridia bacterium]|nr:LCP family protein [Clostridia bacterium]